jgi:hypothetical protein
MAEVFASKALVALAWAKRRRGYQDL